MSASLWTALTLLALVLLSLALDRARRPIPRMIPSPRDTLLPNISSAQAAALPYPPDILPGARDVTTPYGTMRVYEWGPKDGDKVLFIHGDTTPAPMLGPVARNLVERGCRVMIFGMCTGPATKLARLRATLRAMTIMLNLYVLKISGVEAIQILH